MAPCGSRCRLRPQAVLHSPLEAAPLHPELYCQWVIATHKSTAPCHFYPQVAMCSWLTQLVRDTSDPSQLDRSVQRVYYGVHKTAASVPDYLSQHCAIKDAMRLLELYRATLSSK
jgi:hypothetical protein